MARLPELVELAKLHNMKLVSIADLIAHRLEHESLIQSTLERSSTPRLVRSKPSISARPPTTWTIWLWSKEWAEDEAVPVRIHASSMVADIFQVTDFGKGPELHQAMRQIQAAGKGAVVFLNKTRHGGGLADELNAYNEMKRANTTAAVSTARFQGPRHWRPNSSTGRSVSKTWYAVAIHLTNRQVLRWLRIDN